MVDSVVSVLTYKSVETILSVGGTQSWTLNRDRAKACKYAVVCRNGNHPDVEGPEDHLSAFMVGLISDVVPSTYRPGRWLIKFSHYAMVNVPDQFEKRNPVRFWSTDDYEGYIDFKKLKFKPMPDEEIAEAVRQDLGMSIAEAKAALSIRYEVDPSNIDIIIRG